MAARGRKFSFMRLINNAIPNFARDDKLDVDLLPAQADLLVAYQLALPTPLYLGPLAFFWAGMTNSKSISQKIHTALLKHNIISASPTPSPSAPVPSTAETVLTVHTAGITKNFAHQLAVISVHAQRKLVGMLFFWEEECMRWALLNQEEAEILRAIELEQHDRAPADAGARNYDLDIALRAVEMRRHMLPSQRGEGTANVSGGVGFELPAYA